ncbi:hypothetical protein DERP_008721 [Dermatophagoides pteronyssinus]|uniref:Uncharacterized protein n=1 Tax=Dermatophagoides pteronyssinus TaxID=6956 RepID=A0ABQ8IW26_DERPT|nr:hypothetical protein DERP_008721 [Dermatophagoides pteronyssinus]
MIPIKMNPYQIRRYLKLSLIITIIMFLIYTIIELLIIKQYYIRRYVYLHYQYENNLLTNSDSHPHHHHHHNDDDEGILIPTNVDEEISIDEMIISGNNTDNKQQQQQLPKAEKQILSDNIKILTWTIVTGIILVEILYCIIYVYLIEQERFCPILCFAILTLVSLLLRLRQFLSNNNDENRIELFKYSSLTNADRFHRDIEEMDAEQLLDWMTKTDLIEILISFFETILVWIYTVMLRQYPGRRHHRNHRYVQYQQQPPPLNGQMIDHIRMIPNGHAIEMNELSNTDSQAVANGQQQLNDGVDGAGDVDPNDDGNQRLLAIRGDSNNQSSPSSTQIMRSSSSRLNFQRQQLSPSPSSNEQQNGGGGGESNYNQRQQRLNNDVGGGGGGEMEKFLAMQILQAILFTTRTIFLIYDLLHAIINKVILYDRLGRLFGSSSSTTLSEKIYTISLFMIAMFLILMIVFTFVYNYLLVHENFPGITVMVIFLFGIFLYNLFTFGQYSSTSSESLIICSASAFEIIGLIYLLTLIRHKQFVRLEKQLEQQRRLSQMFDMRRRKHGHSESSSIDHSNKHLNRKNLLNVPGVDSNNNNESDDDDDKTLKHHHKHRQQPRHHQRKHQSSESLMTKHNDNDHHYGSS